MFSSLLRSLRELPSRITSKINLRLAALFSAVFIVSSVLLFSLTYLVIASALRREDHDAMGYKLLELWASYRSGGIAAIRRQVSVEKVLGERRYSFIRVADWKGDTLFLIMPESWRRLASGQLGRIFTLPERETIRIQLRDERYLLETDSLRLEDGNLLQIGMNVTDRFSVLERFRSIFALIMIPIALFGFLGGALLADRSLRPIRNIAAAARSIVDTGRIGERVPQKGEGSELDQLVRLFNRMLERIEILVEGMRSALDSVAHDLRTPLTRLRGTAEAALQSSGEQALRQALESSVEESESILTMLNTLMDISEAETGVMKLACEDIDLSRLVEGVVELYRYIAEEKGVALSASVPESLAARGDPGRLRQVVANLLDNAVKYTPPGGSVTVEVGEDGERAFVKVRDTGAGIPAGELPRIWDRLYRGRGARGSSGLGLGLSLVRAVVNAHGGVVQVHNLPRQGSEFTVRLPREG
jgi:signal transduction histidine kinase